MYGTSCSVSYSADLFVKRDRAYGQLEDKGSYLEQLNADISALEEKVKKQQHQEKDKVCASCMYAVYVQDHSTY